MTEQQAAFAAAPRPQQQPSDSSAATTTAATPLPPPPPPPPPEPLGAYLFGSVGSGKTLLMDVFFRTVRTLRRIRTPQLSSP